MVTFRCTGKMLRRLGQPAIADAHPPTNALGDWYVNLVRVGRVELVMATSERSLLTALLPGRDVKRSLVPQLRSTVQRLLIAIGVPADVACQEVSHMSDYSFGKTASRSVLGCMNEFDRLAGFYVLKWSLWEAMLQLADTPMMCTGKGIVAGLHFPSDAAMHLLGLPHTGRQRRVALWEGRF